MTLEKESAQTHAALILETETLRRELKEVREGYERFSVLAAHDLQGAMRKIIQSGEILNMDARDKLSEADLFFLDAMISAAQRLHSTFPDVINYCGMTLYALKKERVSFEAVAKSCVEALMTAVPQESPQSKAKITIGTLPCVFADTQSIETLFKALIENSLKFAKIDGPIAIEICTREEAGFIYIDIIDNGIGIEAAEYVDVFEPFIRLNSKLEYPGSGLGLAASRLICERHDWTLTYLSDPGKTQMTIRMNKSDLR